MVASGYTYSRTDLVTAGTNLGHVGDDITTAAGKPIDDPHVGASHQAGNNLPLTNVPYAAVQFPPADRLLSAVTSRHTQIVSGGKAYGGSVDIMSTAVGDMVKNYDAVDQADGYSAAQLKQSMAVAEGVPGA